MAVVVLMSFEAQQKDTDGFATLGAAAYSSTQHRTGGWSMRCNASSGAAANFGDIVGLNVTAHWIHFGLFVVTRPSVSRGIWGQTGSGYGLDLNSTGTLSVHDGATIIGTSAVLSLNTWYWIGVRPQMTGTSVVWLQIDGVDSITATRTVVGSASSSFGINGSEASAAEVYIDDFIADDAGFLQPSNVDFALPISDNTVTGVTDNNGVTTNIWQCVSNVPPAGVASANEAANPKKGMHFTASVTDNYIANLETYTTLGIVSGDTVLAVRGVVRHGEDIATGTKNLQNVAALTNPTVAGSSVTAGGDAGAHGVEAGLWASTLGTVSTSPSVTLGTSPTIQTSRISESRLACVDFMGMVVAWTPTTVVATQIPYFNPMPPFLAQ